MRNLTFERLCRDVVGLVLASSAAAACGGTVDGTNAGRPGDPNRGPGEPTTEDGWTNACERNGVPGIEGFTPEPGVDYIAERVDSMRSDPGRDPADYQTYDPALMFAETFTQHGQACATATDRDACLTRLQNIRAVNDKSDCSFGMWGTCHAYYFVYTRGDEVGVVKREDLPAVLRFFGKVDTPAEAFLVANLAGYYGECKSFEAENASYRRVGDAIEIVVISSGCNQLEKRVVLRVHPDGRQEVVSSRSLTSTGGCAGRRPDGFRLRGGGDCDDAVGDYLASVAELEDAAVHAFDVMAEELTLAGAPAALVARARTAREDEIRHARTMTDLSRARGGSPNRANVPRREKRSLVDVAIENAVEGCVRETYAALVTIFQSERAEDPDVRAALRSIAVDEVSHASLSIDVGVWLDGRLDAASRLSVAKARLDALADLEREVACFQDPVVRRRVGLPTAAEARALVAATEAIALS